jgi:hypothetical protein
VKRTRARQVKNGRLTRRLNTRPEDKMTSIYPSKPQEQFQPSTLDRSFVYPMSEVLQVGLYVCFCSSQSEIKTEWFYMA